MLPVTGKLEHRKGHTDPVSRTKNVKKNIESSPDQSIMWSHLVTQHKVCRICFAMDVQLHLLMGDVNLYKGYEAVTGLRLADEEDLPPYLCTDCADQVMTCARFRHRSLQAHAMLLGMRKKHGRISLEIIQDVIKTQTQTDYGTVIEHTAKETTRVRNTKRGHKTDGIQNKINDNTISEDIKHVKIKHEINESNEGDSTVSKIKTESVDVNMVCKENVTSIKKENDDINNDGGSISSVNRIKTVHKSNKECGEISDNIIKIKISEETTENNIEPKINDIAESGGFKNIIETEINDLNKEEIIKPNEMKSEINDDAQYNDITIKIELDDECDEIPNDEVRANHFPYEVAVVQNLAEVNMVKHVLVVPGTEVNDMVQPMLGDESVNNDVDGEVDTGEGSLDGLQLRQEDQAREKKALKEVIQETEDEKINKSIDLSEADSNPNKRFECDVCKKKFTRKSSLIVHSHVHDEHNPFMCSICKKSFTRLINLDNHIRLHTGERPFMCDVCEKTYIRKSSLEDHILSHSGVKFKCPVCSKEFNRKRRLDDHIKRKHSKSLGDNHRVKQFVCKLCKKRFARKTSLEEHLRSHSGHRPFKCEVCEKTFTRKNNLEVHVRIHSNQKPFKCNLCDKSFYVNGNLQKHMVTHSKVRPFPCHFCGKSFRLNGNLRQHLMIHSGAKPFKCHLCEDTFRQKNHLQRHLVKHSSGPVMFT